MERGADHIIIARSNSPNHVSLVFYLSFRIPRLGPLLFRPSTARPRSCPKEVPARSQATTNGIDQEAPTGQEGGWTRRQARHGQDPPARHDHRPGDDRLGRRCLRECDCWLHRPGEAKAGRGDKESADVEHVRIRVFWRFSSPSRGSPRCGEIEAGAEWTLAASADCQNGKSFTTVEVKPEMTGHYLGEFS